jgi:hypothetical protein
MRSSSDRVGALAAALAKAQSEIANPDGRRKLGSF